MLGQFDDMLELLKSLSLNNPTFQQLVYIASEHNAKLHPYIVQKLARMGFQVDDSTGDFEMRHVIGQREVAVKVILLNKDITSDHGIESLHQCLEQLSLPIDLIIGQYVLQS